MHSDLFIPKKLSPDELQRYAQDGFLRIGRTLTDEGLRQMRDEVMREWNSVKDPFDSERTWLQNSLLPDIHLRSETVRRYYFSGPLVDIAEQVIGPNIKAATSQLTFKMRGNNKPFAWHQDNAYGELDPYNAISCLTALDNADERTGCLWLIPKSHLQGQADYEFTVEDRESQRAVELDVDSTHAVPVPMNSGECLFFHCHMLHKSEGNMSKERDRRILFMRYADADAVEVYNQRQPRPGRLLRGTTKFKEVEEYEAELPLR